MEGCLVLEVHVVNWWLFWALSFVRPVHVRVFHPWIHRLPRGRMRTIDPAAYLSVDEARLFRSRMVSAWEPWLHHIAGRRWQGDYRGVVVDCQVKVKQEMSRQFERWMFLREVRQQIQQQGMSVVIIPSASMRYLHSLDPHNTGWLESPTTWLSFLNIFLDHLWLRLSSLIYGVRQLAWLACGLFMHRRPVGLLTQQCLPLIYDCDNGNELASSKTKRSFGWVVDDRVIHKSDVLYRLPSSLSAAQAAGLRQAGYLAWAVPALSRYVRPLILMRTCTETLRLLATRCLNPFVGFEEVMVGQYLVRMGDVDPLLRQWRPRVYISSVSSLAQEHPGILYLNAMGVETLMYFMAASYQFAYDEHLPCDFRELIYAHVAASRMVVWHADYKQFFASHPQDGIQIEVIGPLMPGDESVMQEDRASVRRSLALKWAADGGNTKYVVAFDVGVPSWDFRLRQSHLDHQTYPDPYQEGYTIAFLQNMLRLLEEHNDIRLLYKPRRNAFGLGRRFYSDSSRELLKQIQAHGRGCMLEEEINPWIPLAVADICIGQPFSSPIFAALHYGIPMICHDPLGNGRAYRCRGLSAYVTHGYEALSSRLRQLSTSATAAADSPSDDGAAAGEFKGVHPGTNSTERFRELLRVLMQDGVADLGTGEHPSQERTPMVMVG